MIVALVIASLVSFALYAQAADKVSEIISAREASYGQAACCARGTVKNEAEYEDALNVLKEKGFADSSVNASDKITMKELAKVCSYTWKIEGSLMCKLVGSPRYIFRQMKADEVIDVSADPMGVPSGRNLLAVITDCIDRYQVKDGEDK